MANLTSKQKNDLNRMNRAAQSASLGNVLESVYPQETTQAIVANGAITIKNGVVTLAKTVAGVLSVTIADPVAADNFKILRILNLQAQANVITSASSFGGGGTSFDVATFSAAIGGTLTLMAFDLKWYVVGSQGITLS